MSQVKQLGALNERLRSVFVDLGVGASFDGRSEQIQPGDDRLHLTFTYAEEDLVDQLIRTARKRFASSGPEYWLPCTHPGSKQFEHENPVCFRVQKSLIQSHFYWGVSFILCSSDEGYSMVENTQT